MRNRILVVDDETDIRELLAEALSRAGYIVATAENGEAALELLAKRFYAVMFFDLRMPGISGIDLCREVRKTHPVPVIYAMTGYGRLFEVAECRSVGFDDYFLKPIDLAVLRRAAETGAECVGRWTGSAWRKRAS